MRSSGECGAVVRYGEEPGEPETARWCGCWIGALRGEWRVTCGRGVCYGGFGDSLVEAGELVAKDRFEEEGQSCLDPSLLPFNCSLRGS